MKFDPVLNPEENSQKAKIQRQSSEPELWSPGKLKIAVSNLEKIFVADLDKSELEKFGYERRNSSIQLVDDSSDSLIGVKNNFTANLPEIEKIKESYFTMKKEKAEQRRLDLIKIPIHR